MRRYETIVILDPDLSETDRTSLTDRIKEILPQQNGVLLEEDLWGTKKLAYEIKKKPRGYYARYDYCGEGALVDELERFFRIDDRVLKYLTVQLDPEADVEKIQAEIAAAKETQSVEPQSAEETDQPPASQTESRPTAEQTKETVTPTETAEEE